MPVAASVAGAMLLFSLLVGDCLDFLHNGHREHMGAFTFGAQCYLAVCVACECASMSLGSFRRLSSFISLSFSQAS